MWACRVMVLTLTKALVSKKKSLLKWWNASNRPVNLELLLEADTENECSKISFMGHGLTLFPGGPGGPASPDGPGGPWKQARKQEKQHGAIKTDDRQHNMHQSSAKKTIMQAALKHLGNIQP